MTKHVPQICVLRKAKPMKGQGMPDFSAERALQAKGFKAIAGADEAGRGPLAGPVVSAAVILDPARIPEGLDDSKRLSEAARNRLAGEIRKTSSCAVCLLPPALIDSINIRAASLEAMRRAIAALPLPADHALIDGRDVPQGLFIPAISLVRGDSRSLSIAAASILAKVTRDAVMRRLGMENSGYAFEKHMGYPTVLHRAAIHRLGLTIHHRKSFSVKPVQERNSLILTRVNPSQP
jgi:ribonuclease HII